MQIPKYTLACALTALTAACSGTAPAGVDSTVHPPAEAHTRADTPPESPTRLEAQCNGHRWALVDDGPSARVERDRETDPLVLQKPGGMDAYVPVGLGCAQSRRGGQSLVIEYGAEPGGCKVCEWFFVYDADGLPLNQSVPPTRGQAESLAANNDGYSSVLQALDLQHPRIDYPPPNSR